MTDLSEQEKWDAVLRGDRAFDDLFFYGVRTTGIFCRPSCRSKKPLRRNIEFMNTAKEAMEKGYRACKKCNPGSTTEGDSNLLAAQMKRIFDDHFNDRERLSREMERLGIHRNRLIRSFRNRYHTTPTKYLNGLRVEKAARLLEGSDKSMMDIASECGFGSVPSFYGSFKSRYRQTPSEFRRNRPNSRTDGSGGLCQ